MGNVVIKGKGRGIRFHQQFLNRPAELRSRLLGGEEVEINEGDLRHLLKGSYEIVGKVPSSNEPSATQESEPDSSNVRANEASDSEEADSSSEGVDEEAGSARKPRYRKSRN